MISPVRAAQEELLGSGARKETDKAAILSQFVLHKDVGCGTAQNIQVFQKSTKCQSYFVLLTIEIFLLKLCILTENNIFQLNI